MNKKTIVQGQKQNFETLSEAFANGDVCLLECQIAATGEVVAAICAAQTVHGEVEFVPFAIMINGNPYEVLNPPKPDGNFMSQEEVWAEG